MNKKLFPVHVIIGGIFILISWLLNWLLPGLRSHLLFFPLWFGYSLFVDAIVFYRKGNSPFTRNWKAYIVLFIASALIWWLFEFLNSFTQNWIHLGEEHFTQFEYSFYETLSFTTVIPTVLCAENI